MSADEKINILLVDDEPANLVALEATLESLGQNLVKAAGAKDALREALDKDFAVILLDVQMPVLNGIEVASLIRERDRTKRVPIIFLTGLVKTEEMMFKGYSTGAVDYLLKPIVPEILRAKVEVFVELDRTRKKLQREVTMHAEAGVEITRLNQALELKNENLVAANGDLNAFSYSVSHDLRAPLRHIQGYIGLLENSAAAKLDDKERQRLHVIRDSAERMNHLIEGLLKFSQIGQADLFKKQVDMNALLQDIIEEIKPDLSGRNVVWDVQSLPEVPGDSVLLGQVWSNLVANAVKYTRPRDPARIEIGVQAARKETVFHVRDNGVGFNMDYADNLFGVFRRLHSDAQFEGTGIGLANVRRIVQRHGGRTWAESKENEGSSFYFSLPS